MPEHREFQV